MTLVALPAALLESSPLLSFEPPPMYLRKGSSGEAANELKTETIVGSFSPFRYVISSSARLESVLDVTQESVVCLDLLDILDNWLSRTRCQNLSS